MGLFDFLFTRQKSKPKTKFQSRPGPTPLPVRKRVFISFAVEDNEYRGHLVSQAKQNRSPFYFIDMSVKRPWDEAEWRKKCRSRIKGCDGVIVLLSNYTYHASGARWEMKCANETGVKMIGMRIRKSDTSAVPPELEGKPVITWNWNNLERFVNSL
ncbi:MAG TPA: TIR domain-containing protein [Hymenobacter sp.]|jgi:hypothetical protein|uniref:TIR domain-containing protein n=1 Tax=Hymenobacter sp. TaxID=1898978 RepID=UPI002ED7866C